MSAGFATELAVNAPRLAMALSQTVMLSLAGAALGTLLGVPLGVVMFRSRLPLRLLLALYVDLVRGTPVLVLIGFAMQLVGGLSVMLGIMPAYGAAILILFLIGATSLFHNLFLFTGEARAPHLYFTLVNCALAGYCLMVIGLSII